MDLQESKEGLMGGFRERKGKIMWLFLKSKKKIVYEF